MIILSNFDLFWFINTINKIYLWIQLKYFICGVVLSIRHYNNKICIWTCNQNEETNLKIGRLFKKNCELNNNDKIYYQLHNRNPKDGYEPLYQL